MAAKIELDTEIRPLYSYTPNYLHNYLEAVKKETTIPKSDVVNLLLELSMKYLTFEEIEKLHNDFIVLGREGLDLANAFPPDDPIVEQMRKRARQL